MAAVTSTGNDPATSLPPDASAALPDGWSAGAPDEADAAELTELLRGHEKRGRGWAGASEDDLLVEVSARGYLTRENVVLRDARRRDPRLGQRPRPGRRPDAARAWSWTASSTTRPPTGSPTCCSAGPTSAAAGSAAERGLDVQQIDSGAFADDDRQHRLAGAGRLRAGPHLVADEPPGRPPDEADLRRRASSEGVRIRLVRAAGHRDARRGRPAHGPRHPRERVRRPLQLPRGDLRRVRVPAARGPRPPLGPLVDRRARRRRRRPEPAGALVGAVSEGAASAPDGSYVEYIGVLQSARGRGVAKSLLTHGDRRRRRPRPRPGRPRGRRRLPDRRRRPLLVDGLEDEVRHRVVAPGRAGAPPACMRRLARALGRVRPRVTRAVPVVSVVVRGEAGPGRSRPSWPRATRRSRCSSRAGRRRRAGRGLRHLPSASRDAAVSAATGTYLVFVSPGEVVPPDAWPAMVAALEETGSDLALGGRRGPEVRPWAQELTARRLLRQTVDGLPLATVDLTLDAKMFRTSSWRASGASLDAGAGDEPAVLAVLLAATTFDVLPRVASERPASGATVPISEQPRFRPERVAARVDALLEAAARAPQGWRELVATHVLPPLYVDAVGGGVPYLEALRRRLPALLEGLDLAGVPVGPAWGRGARCTGRGRTWRWSRTCWRTTRTACLGTVGVVTLAGRLSRGCRRTVAGAARDEDVDPGFATAGGGAGRPGRRALLEACFVEHRPVDRDPEVSAGAGRRGRPDVEVPRSGRVPEPVGRACVRGPQRLPASRRRCPTTSPAPAVAGHRPGRGALGEQPGRTGPGGRSGPPTWCSRHRPLGGRLRRSGTGRSGAGVRRQGRARCAASEAADGARPPTSRCAPTCSATRCCCRPGATGRAGLAGLGRSAALDAAAGGGTDERSASGWRCGWRTEAAARLVVQPPLPPTSAVLRPAAAAQRGLRRTGRGAPGHGAAGDLPRAQRRRQPRRGRSRAARARDLGLDLVWVVDDPAVTVPDGTRAVARRTAEWYDLLGHAAGTWATRGRRTGSRRRRASSTCRPGTAPR